MIISENVENIGKQKEKWLFKNQNTILISYFSVFSLQIY